MIRSEILKRRIETRPSAKRRRLQVVLATTQSHQRHLSSNPQWKRKRLIPRRSGLGKMPSSSPFQQCGAWSNSFAVRSPGIKNDLGHLLGESLWWPESSCFFSALEDLLLTSNSPTELATVISWGLRNLSSPWMRK